MTAKRSYSAEEWQRKLEEIKVSKGDLNALVMNYLIIEGYQSAAIKFAQEANISPSIDLDSINDRIAIRNAIYRGDIQGAIEHINELNPELLDTNPSLHFSLLRLQLIELIRQCSQSPNGDIGPALAFATQQLAPRAHSSPGYLADLERTMALLCFPTNSLAPPLAELMDPSLRRHVAAKVNEAILEEQGVMREAKVRGLVRLWSWGEQKLQDEKVDFPLLDISAKVS